MMTSFQGPATSVAQPRRSLDERRRVAMTTETLHVVDTRMQMAKRRFSLAALACLRGAPDAAQMVAKALAEVDAARKALYALQAQPVSQAHAARRPVD